MFSINVYESVASLVCSSDSCFTSGSACIPYGLITIYLP